MPFAGQAAIEGLSHERNGAGGVGKGRGWSRESRGRRVAVERKREGSHLNITARGCCRVGASCSCLPRHLVYRSCPSYGYPHPPLLTASPTTTANNASSFTFDARRFTSCSLAIIENYLFPPIPSHLPGLYPLAVCSFPFISSSNGVATAPLSVTLRCSPLRLRLRRWPPIAIHDILLCSPYSAASGCPPAQ